MIIMLIELIKKTFFGYHKQVTIMHTTSMQRLIHTTFDTCNENSMYVLNKHNQGNKTIFDRCEQNRIFKLSEQLKL